VPLRTSALIEGWLEEFRALGYSGAGHIRVVPLADGGEEGVLAAQLTFGPTRYYVAPAAPGAREWRITFEEREEPATMTASRVLALSVEFATLSALCAFLQARSDAMFAEMAAGTLSR
jgi:hypothetical protein